MICELTCSQIWAVHHFCNLWKCWPISVVFFLPHSKNKIWIFSLSNFFEGPFLLFFPMHFCIAWLHWNVHQIHESLHRTLFFFFWMKVGEKYCISFPFISWIYDWPVAIHLYSRYSDSNEKLFFFFWILQDLFWHSSLCSEEFWEEWLFSQVSDKRVTVETCLKQYLNLWKICRFGVDNWVNWECCSKWKSVRILTRYFWRSHISEVVWALANKSQ